MKPPLGGCLFPPSSWMTRNISWTYLNPSGSFVQSCLILLSTKRLQTPAKSRSCSNSSVEATYSLGRYCLSRVLGRMSYYLKYSNDYEGMELQADGKSYVAKCALEELRCFLLDFLNRGYQKHTTYDHVRAAKIHVV